MKNVPKICSVIDIGSDTVKMGIYQNSKGTIKCLDQLAYPVTLGHEIFNFGQVTFSSLHELSAILEKYKTASAGFGAEDIHVVSTTVMREAENSALIADRIRIQNELDVHTLSDSEEKSLLYFDIISRIEAAKLGINKAVIAYVGSGSIGIAYYEEGCISRSFNIPIGSLKLHDILGTIKNEMSDYYVVVEEYLHSILQKVDIDGCDCLIITGTEIRRIAALCGADVKSKLPVIPTSALKSLYKNMRAVTAENLALRLNIDEESANVFSTSLSIYHELLDMVGKSAKIIAPSVSMEEIIAFQLLTPEAKVKYRKHVSQSAVKSAQHLAKKYNCNTVHYHAISHIVCELFDKMKKIHGLDERHRNILEVAAILHSCGQYVNIKLRTRCSFDLIKNMDIYGMTQEDIRLIAFVSGYNEFNVPDSDDMNYRILSDTERIAVAKLVAMFRLANALDKSQKNKISLQKIQIKEDVLTISVTASENILLEQWAFQECADFFREIFGIKPELSVKTTLI